MISYRSIKKYCKEDPSKIENYDKAIADTTQVWDCHHRLEIQNGTFVSLEVLVAKNLYYDRPASELIFLTPSEHMYIHGKNRKASLITKKKMSEARKKENNPFYGKKHSEETKEKLRAARAKQVFSEEDIAKAKVSRQKTINTMSIEERKQKFSRSEHLKGRKLSEETKRKIAEAHKGKKLSEKHKLAIKNGLKNKGNKK